MKKIVSLLAALTVSIIIGATGAMALSLSAEGGYALSNGASVAIYATDAAWYNISFSVTDMYGVKVGMKVSSQFNGKFNFFNSKFFSSIFIFNFNC